MRRPPVRVMIVASILMLCIGSCGWLTYRLSGIYRTTPSKELGAVLRSCTHSTYDVQYCLGLVPTVQSMYPALYHSEAYP